MGQIINVFTHELKISGQNRLKSPAWSPDDPSLRPLETVV